MTFSTTLAITIIYIMMVEMAYKTSHGLGLVGGAAKSAYM